MSSACPFLLSSPQDSHQQRTSKPCNWCPLTLPTKTRQVKKKQHGFWKAPCFCRQYLGLLQNNPHLAEAIALLKILLPFTDHDASGLTFLTQSNWGCTDFYKQK